MKRTLPVIVPVIMMILWAACSGGRSTAVDPDKLRSYAGELVTRGLYRQAVDAYEQVLASGKIDEKEQANIHYIIANLYFDRLGDYENALAYYLRIKHFYPQAPLMSETEKKIVACLERLDRLPKEGLESESPEETAAVPAPAQTQRLGEVVAEIGKRQITTGDLDYAVSLLPSVVRDMITTPEQKRAFLRELAAAELLYETAQQSGLDRDPDVIAGTLQAKKSLMVQKLLQERAAGKVQVEPVELESYFEANREKYAERDAQGNILSIPSLDQVRDRVQKDLLQSKQQSVYQGLIEKMILAEGAKLYENKVK